MNAFFGWEFNSAEMLVKGDEVYPIDYANACPDVAVTSLHYYFPWAIKALVRWSVYCLVTGRQVDVDLHDRALLRDRRRRRPSTTTPSSRRTWRSPTSTSRPSATGSGATSTCRTCHEQVLDWVTGPTTSTGCCVDTVAATYPAHEQEQFLAHFRGLVGMWATDQAELSGPRATA